MTSLDELWVSAWVDEMAMPTLMVDQPARMAFRSEPGHDDAGKVSRLAPEHLPGSLPKWLQQQDVDAVVVSAIGERALILLADAGIEAFLADGDKQPGALATACLEGRLARANQENSRCGGHHDHDGHECHH